MELGDAGCRRHLGRALWIRRTSCRTAAGQGRYSLQDSGRQWSGKLGSLRAFVARCARRENLSGSRPGFPDSPPRRALIHRLFGRGRRNQFCRLAEADSDAATAVGPLRTHHFTAAQHAKTLALGLDGDRHLNGGTHHGGIGELNEHARGREVAGDTEALADTSSPMDGLSFCPLGVTSGIHFAGSTRRHKAAPSISSSALAVLSCTGLVNFTPSPIRPSC